MVKVEHHKSQKQQKSTDCAESSSIMHVTRLKIDPAFADDSRVVLSVSHHLLLALDDCWVCLEGCLCSAQQ